MTNQYLVEIACPNCLNPIDVREHGRHVTCDACRSQFILQAHLCAQCGAYHKQDEVVCGECAAPLVRLCRKCNTSNWAGDEHCQKCGAIMDILDILAQNQSGYTADRLSRQMSQAQELRAAEEVASQKRMAELMAIEEERLANLRQRRLERKAEERKLVLLIGGAGVLLLLFVIVYLLAGMFL
jgi:hypothetical protein